MENLIQTVKKHRFVITILLALTGIGLMIYYDYCDTACSYLQGDIIGIDLKWIGIGYMAAIIIFAALKQFDFVRALLAAGLGVEVFLFSYQIQNNIFCPFCIAFAVTVILAFIINYEESPSWRENQLKMWPFFLGEVNFPMLKIRKLPLVVVALIGYFFIFFTFSSSTLPVYAQNKNSFIPSLGEGQYEVILFSSYFCPPCRNTDIKAEPLIREMLETGKVKVTFIDVPFSRAMPIYAKYYLYAANVNADEENIFRVRHILFKAAQEMRIQKEDELVKYLKERKVKWKKMDEKSIFPFMSAVIQEYKINATPTCVIKYSATDEKKYIGSDKIWEGLVELKTHLQK
ncbi:MAG TPA: hypothetical protein ENN23_04660 [Deltaproteobacteria bacterium]|nr:hypothetical protein [Deltaproteobacteria bacterium]